MGPRIGPTKIKDCWLLRSPCRFLYAALVSSFAPTTLNVELIVEQGCKNFHRIDRSPDHPLAATEDTPAMYEKFVLDALYVCCANPLSSGIVVSFVLMWAILIVQVFWECEITRPGWKQIPGSICIFPRSVPIALMISKLPPCASVYLFLSAVFSNGHFGFYLSRHSVDGKANFAASLVGPGYFLIHEPRSPGVFATGRCITAYFLSSPCQS